jgi:hypothetical protein
MEIRVIRLVAALSFVVLALSPLPVRAESTCAVGFKPDTSGFALNPVLDKLTVTSAKPGKAGDVCALQVSDEILKVNQQPVPGSRALTVMKYWKSLKDGLAITFLVKRDGAVITVITK